MTRLPNAFAWEAAAKWYYTEERVATAPIAGEVERYESDGKVVLYWPLRDSGTLIWNAEKAE